MKKYTVFLMMIFFLPPIVMGQEKTVNRLNSEWVRLYRNGCELLNKANFKDATFEIEKSILLLEKNNAFGTNSYIYSLLKLAEIYASVNEKGKLTVLEQEIKRCGNLIRPGSEKYLNYNYCLAIFYSNTSQYKKAIDIIDNVLSDEKLLEDKIVWKNKYLHRKALCYYCLNDCKEAIKTERLTLNSNNYNTENLQTYIHLLAKENDFEEIEKWIQTCYDITREPILRKFSFSNAEERAAYWAKYGLFFTQYLPLYTSSHPSESMTSVCYDAVLLAKGILLAATNRTSDMILTSGDKSLVESYLRYMFLKGKEQKSIDEDFETQALHDIFVKYQSDHKKMYRDDFRIRWTNVQEHLSGKDVAIEFINVNHGFGRQEYAALVIKKGYSSPHYIKLCTNEDISKISQDNIYTSPMLYGYIWKPLEKELDGVEDIYFSPSGAFLQIGIEYLANEDSINMNNLYSMHRLSSTKELVKGNRVLFAGNTALFGGFNYDAPILTSTTQALHKVKEQVHKTNNADSINIRGIMLNKRVKYLPGTQREISEINKILTQENVKKVYLYQGDNGTESNFKNIVNDNCSVLHVATHGFFYNQNDKQSVDDTERTFRDLNMRFTSDEVQVLDEDKMLTKSGLIFAGADNVINGISIPQGVDDGILYANEVSSLNLNSVDLLVLSACQSGLGSVAGSEGVFGLQRGFKLAGVHSIMMSLWKVDDDATQILMAEFYKNVVNGKDYGKALSEAQNSLRIIDDGKYDSPHYWAAFVLLDAI